MKVFFDGGCRGASRRMEAAVVTGGRTTVLPDLGHGSSSDAEWLALLHALRIARSLGLSDVVLLGDSADVVAKANGAVRCRGDALRRLAEFRALATGGAPFQVRRVKRTQNLAGIALARLHAR